MHTALLNRLPVARPIPALLDGLLIVRWYSALLNRLPVMRGHPAFLNRLPVPSVAASVARERIALFKRLSIARGPSHHLTGCLLRVLEGRNMLCVHMCARMCTCVCASAWGLFPCACVCVCVCVR